MSETTNLKLKKHDNPATNEEQFDIENYLNGNWDKLEDYSEKINTEISNIKSKNIEQNSQIEQLQTENTELKEECKRLKEDNNSISIEGKASGEKIYLNDSSSARVSKIGISGKHEQEMREGYNLLNFDVKQDSRVTVNEDGTIIVNGTGGFTLKFKQFTAKANTKYYIKWELVRGIVDTSKSDGNSFLNPLDSTNIKQGEFKESIVENDKDISGFWVNNMAVFTNAVIKFWANTNKSDFEQYGAMPSPDYPSKIKTVGDNVNIFDLENYYNAIGTNACTKKMLNTGIRISFAKGADAYVGDVYYTGTTMTENKKSTCIKVKPDTTYTLKMSSAPKCYMSFFDRDYKSVKDYVRITSNNYIFTTNSSTYYIYLRLGYQDETSELTSYDFTDIKCVEGTEVGEYSKYGQGCVKVTKCNKNILNIVDIDETEKYGITYSIKNGILKLNGTATANFDILLSKNIKIKKGKYMHSSSYIQSGLYISFDNLERTMISSILGKKRTFELAEDTTYKKYFIWINKGTVLNNVKIELQLETGNEANAFEEHQEQSYIMPVQQEMLEGDYLDFDNEEEVHIWNKLVLTGNENWGYQQNCFVYNDIDDIKQTPSYSDKGQYILISNCFIAQESGYRGEVLDLHIIKVIDASKPKQIAIKNTRISTVDEWKAKLAAQYEAGTPVIIYYKLETPTKLPFTEEQKTEAKGLKNARTYKNITHIYSTDEVSPIIDITYKKDFETLLNNMQAQIISNASGEVE